MSVIDNWRLLGANDTIIDWIKHGVKFEMNGTPEPYVQT
jgi:hypothetical protein